MVRPLFSVGNIHMLPPVGLDKKRIVVFGDDAASRRYENEARAWVAKPQDACSVAPLRVPEIHRTENIDTLKALFDSDAAIVLVSKRTERMRILDALGFSRGAQYDVAPLLTQIKLYVANRCNAACKMCDVGMASGTGIDQLRGDAQRELDIALVDRILHDPYVAHNEQPFLFVLGMVEPLLHPQIDVITEMIKARGHRAVLLTNGILLERKALGLVENGLDAILVSLDGPADLHDRIRGRTGAYRKAVAGIRRLKTLKPELPILVSCTISNLNQHALHAFLVGLDAEDIGIDEVRVQFMYFTSARMCAAHAGLMLEELSPTVSSVSDEVSLADMDIPTLVEQVRLARASRFRNIRELSIRPELEHPESLCQYFDEGGAKIPGYDRCYFPYNQLTIKTNGDAVFHSRCFDYTLGSIRDNNVSDVFYGSRASRFRQHLSEQDFCFPACTRCCGVMKER